MSYCVLLMTIEDEWVGVLTNQPYCVFDAVVEILGEYEMDKDSGYFQVDSPVGRRGLYDRGWRATVVSNQLVIVDTSEHAACA